MHVQGTAPFTTKRQTQYLIVDYNTSQKSVFRRTEQAECEAKIRDEWLLRPREGLTTEESKEVQTEIDNIVAADQPAEKITTCRGAVTLFFCASPSESQRQELRNWQR